jgi:hypothetical protein
MSDIAGFFGSTLKAIFSTKQATEEKQKQDLDMTIPENEILPTE